MKKIKKFFKNFSQYKIAFDGIILTFVRCFTLLTTIIQTMIISRLLSLTDYGIYSQLLIIISITATISSLGLNNAVNYFYNKFSDEENKNNYVSNIFSLTIISGIIGALFCFAFRFQIANYFKTPIVSSLIVYIIFKPLLDNIINLYNPLYISLNKTKLIAIRNAIISLLKMLLIPLVFYITKSIKWMLIVQIILDLLQIFYFSVNVKKYIKINKIKNFFDKEIVIEIFKYSIPLAIATMMGTLFKESDKLIIAKFSTIDNLAIYSNMSKQLPFEFISACFMSVIMPTVVKLIHLDKQKVISLWKDFLEFSYIISWILCVGALICNKELLIFLYSQKYVSGLNIFNIYIITEFFRFTYFGLILSACGKTKYITLSSLFSLIINLSLNCILYFTIGLSGPAWATLISVLIMGLSQLIFSCKILKTNLLEIFDIKKMLMFLIKLISIGIVCYFIKLLLLKFVKVNFIVLSIIYILFVLLNLIINKQKIIYLIKEMK